MTAPGARAAVLAVLALLGIGAVAPAQSDGDPGAAYREAAAAVDADLRAALDELADLRRALSAERPPLALETEAVAAELREKRFRAELAKQERDALLHDLGSLSERVRVWRDEGTYIQGLLGDFAKQHQTRLGVAELELGAAAPPGGATAVVRQSIGRLGQVRGGSVRAGEAIAPDGVSHRGTFVDAGPVSWFLAGDGGLAGLATEGRDLRAEVVLGTADAGALRALLAGEEVEVGFDPTLGSALALERIDSGLIHQVRQGGLWIYPILLLALVSAVAAATKWLQLSRVRDVPPELLRRAIGAVNAGHPDEARQALAGLRHPARAVLLRGVDAAAGHETRETVEEALYEEFLAAQPGLQRWLPPIAIASATAPLLGLLGTVTGMIHTFRLIKVFGTGDAKPLASGISEALITTEFGLAVAIPSLILHALLSRKVQGIRSGMEMASLAFVNGIDRVVGAGDGTGAGKGGQG
jgi:biopolymer transport protein ExbB